MARHPEWFERLPAIAETVRQAAGLDRIGRKQLQTIFSCSERDSIRLLHKFGAEEHDDALSLPRSALLAQLDAILAGETYAAFLRQREDVLTSLASARAEASAREFRATPRLRRDPHPRFEDLPPTIAWRRTSPAGPGRFEIVYDDGADLLWQLAEFLTAAGANRQEFLAHTEPSDGQPN